MATLYIAEYSGGLPDSMPLAGPRALTTQTVAMSGTHAESSAFSGDTKVVRIHTDAICSLLFGSAPVATASHPRMAADQTEYFYVKPGDKVSAITNT